VDSSEGTLSEKDALVSQASGLMDKVAVYTDPQTGMKISPDPGWSYNPGMINWNIDLKQYDPDIAKLF
jgi:hypothetical protein